MGKASKKKSRRDHRGSRRSNDDMEHAKKQTGESSSVILTDLNSLDSHKRTSAIVMFKDLLLQNLNNVTVIGKLTTPETLSSLSLRLIDSNRGIRLQAVKCFLAIVRSGAKFAEKLVSLGIQETIKQMLVELTSLPSEGEDEVDDLLCIVYLLGLHCPNVFSSSADALVSLSLSNLSPSVSEGRRVSFSEYLLNCSSNATAVVTQQGAYSALYRELCALTATQKLADESESPSNYLLVLQSAVMLNLLSALPSFPLDNTRISSTLLTLTDSLHLSHPSLPSNGSDSMAVVADGAQESTDSTDTIIGKYKSLSMKVAADALSRFFTEHERIEDSSSSLGKRKASPPSADFKGRFKAAFNTFFSVSLLSAVRLAALSTSKISAAPVPVVAPVVAVGSEVVSEGERDSMDVMSGVAGVTGMDGAFSTEREGGPTQTAEAQGTEAQGESNVDDVLEVFLTSLCTATDYAALSLDDLAVRGFISGFTEVLEILYSSFCLLSATASTTEEDSDVREEVERLRYLTTAVCECVSSLVQHAAVPSFAPLVGEEGAVLTQRLALILCRCATSIDTDISIPCIGAMGFLGAKHDLLETASKGFIVPKINWLLSNAILRILDGISGPDSQPEKNAFLFEMCLSSFIDLHSSDDTDILQNFIKLKAIEKLSAGLHLFEGIVTEMSEENRINKRRNNKADEDEADLQAILMDFEETILNSHSFLEYKANYCK